MSSKRHSKVLEKKAKQDKRIWQYYYEDGSHWIILNDGYEFDYGIQTTGEPNVRYALARISQIYTQNSRIKEEEKQS